MGKTSKFEMLPESVQKLVEHGIALVKPEAVILFGSRARGDATAHSDYDIAFKNLGKPDKWAAFTLDYDELPLTLFKVDLLNYSDCSSEYRTNIDQEGIVIYEN